MNRLPLLLGCAFLTMLPQVAFALGGSGAAEVDPAEVSLVIHVDSRLGDDAMATGAPDFPYRSLQAALYAAASQHAAGNGVKILVRAGDYLEGSAEQSTALNLPSVEGDLPFIIEGEGWSPGVHSGDVVITGSELWTDWVEESPGVYYKTWSYDFPLTPLGQFGATEDIMPEVVRRKEMVHVNGETYYQFSGSSDPKMTYLEPTEGAMWIDEAADRIYLKLPASTSITDLNNAQVEVTVRQRLAHFWRPGGSTSRTPYVLRNLVFKHAGEYGLFMQNMSGVIIEDCSFSNNNQRGMAFDTDLSGLTFRRNQAVRNGEMGLSFKVADFLAEDVLLERNSRQSLLAEYLGWGIGGVKFGHTRGATLRRWTAIDNYGIGIWLDTGCSGMEIEHATMTGNFSSGIFVENNNRNNVTALGDQDTVVVRESVIVNNRGDANRLLVGKGILVTESENVTFDHCLIYGNEHQVSIADGPGRGPTGAVRIFNSVIGSNVLEQDLYNILYGSIGWLEFFDDLDVATNDNRYYHPDADKGFRSRSQNRVDFANWKSQHTANPNNLNDDLNVDSRSVFVAASVPELPLVRAQPVRNSRLESEGVVDGFLFRRITDDFSSPLTVFYSVRQEAGDATSGIDFSPLSGALTIPAGAATEVLSVGLFGEDGLEPAEALTLTLQPSSDYFLTSSEASFFVQDENGSLPGFGVVSETSQAVEGGGGALVFRVVRSDDYSEAVMLKYTINGTASEGIDYPVQSGVLGFAVGESEKLLTIVPSDDADPEFSETLVVTLSESPNYGIHAEAGSATALILDNDLISHQSVNAALSPGTGPVTVTLTLNNPSDATVNFSLTRPESNYTWVDSVNSSLNYDWIEIIDNPDPGQNGTIVAIEGASSEEYPYLHGDITWFNPDHDDSGYYGGMVRDPQPNENTTEQVNRGSDSIPLGFDFPFYGANFAEIFIATSGYVTFEDLPGGYHWYTAFGGSFPPSRIRPQDSISENTVLPVSSSFSTVPGVFIAGLWDQWFFDPGVSILSYKLIGSDQFVITYENLRHLTLDSSTHERTSFQIVLNSNGSILMNYKTVYVPNLVYLGSTVGIQDDSTYEGLTVAHNSRFIRDAMSVRIDPPANWLSLAGTEIAVPAQGSATVDVILDASRLLQNASFLSQITIHSDVPGEPSVIVPVALDVRPKPGEIAFSSAASNVAEGAGRLEVTLTRSDGDNGAVSVLVQSSGGSASEGQDFSAVSRTIGWADGDVTDKSVTLSLTDDLLEEGNETLVLQLINPTGGAILGEVQAHAVTILDNDGPLPSIVSGQTATGRVGVDFSYFVTVENNPILFATGDLPAGLSVDSLTGEISGRPETDGVFAIDLSATNGAGTSSETAALEITILPEVYEFGFNPSALYDDPTERSDLTLMLLGDSSAAERLLLESLDADRLTVVEALTRAAGSASVTTSVQALEDGLNAGHASVEVRVHRTGANVWDPMRLVAGIDLNGSDDGFGWGDGWTVTQGSWQASDDPGFDAFTGSFGRVIRGVGNRSHSARRPLNNVLDGSGVVWVSFVVRDGSFSNQVWLGLDSLATRNTPYECHLQFGIYNRKIGYRYNYGSFVTAGSETAQSVSRVIARIDRGGESLHLWLNPNPLVEPVLADAVHAVGGLSFQNYGFVLIGTNWENGRIGELRFGPSFESVVSKESFSGTITLVDEESATRLENWRMTHYATPFGEGVAADEAEGVDGVPNLLKYAAGVGPAESLSASDRFRIERDGATGLLVLRFVRDPNATDISFSIDSGVTLPPGDLIWTAGDSPQAPVDSVMTDVQPDGREEVILKVNPGEDRQLFFRLGVSP